MSLVSQSIKNLKGGISQQPDILRYPDQGCEQVNCYSSEVEGLQKRPPTVHRRRLGDNGYLGVKPYVHTINRDEKEQYYVTFDGTRLRVFDLINDGAELSVASPNGWDYIKTDSPRNDLRMVTVADYTFVINHKIVVGKGTGTTPNYAIDNHAIINVKGAQYGKVFRIYLNGKEVAYHKTPIGDKVEQADEIDIKFIINKLVESYNSGQGKPIPPATEGGATTYEPLEKPAGSTAVAKEGYLLINSPSTELTDIKVEDGYNGQLLKGIIHTTQNTTDLPLYAPDGYMVNISGEATSTSDDYWVRFKSSENIWVEAAEPNIPSDYNDATMPHTLIRLADGSFEFKQADWIGRVVGDDESNPFPSFVGNTVNDIFFYRNRLGFLSGENVILSVAGEYFNFFPNSVAVTSDSDPIDVAVSTNRISILKYAIPFAEELLLWAEQVQFVMTADGVLSPTSVRLDLTTEFEVNDKAKPHSVGRGVYFVSPRARYSSIRRFYAVADVTQVKNAEDISAHVPSYIENGVFQMAGSSTENFITVLTEGDESRVYIYKYLYQQEQLAQQSWSHWHFKGSRVFVADMIAARIHLIIESDSGVYLETMEFTTHTRDYEDEPYRLYIDRKIEHIVPTGRFDDETYQTRINLADIYGAAPTCGDYYFVRPYESLNPDAPAYDRDALMFRIECPDGGWGNGDIFLHGNWENEKFFVGETYEMKYVFSKLLIKSSDTQGGFQTEDVGRLQLRRAWLNYNLSGYFHVGVNNKSRNYEYRMTAIRLGDKSATVGDVALHTGVFNFPISGNANECVLTLRSDTPNAVSIIGGGWEGNYVRRTRGI